MDSDSDPSLEEERSSDEETYGEHINFWGIKENNPLVTVLCESGNSQRIQNITDEEWEELGRDISNNTQLNALRLYEGALDDHRMSFLFRGLTRSNSIQEMQLHDNDWHENGLSVAGVRSMVPFLQNANKLLRLDLDDNNLQTEGFNMLFRALRDSQIEYLSCDRCGIDSIEIDNDYFPKHLKYLCLNNNMIDADGCRELAKLLKGVNATLDDLLLRRNKIDDEGVAILVDALRNNTSLKSLGLSGNRDISKQGQIMLLKLVNNISSIKATLQSNNTLLYLVVKDFSPYDVDDEIQTHINIATGINTSYESYPSEFAGREKVIRYQLHSEARAELCRLQEVDGSLYSEIDPLHLPEVLSLIDRRHGQGELYVALLSSIMTLFSTMDWEKYIQKQREYYEAKIAEYRAKIEELDAKLATMKEAAGKNQDDMESQSNKRRRT